MTNSISNRLGYIKYRRQLSRAVSLASRRGTGFLVYVFLLLISASSMLFAQTAGKISGVVTDSETGEPLIGANVIILGTSLGAATDLDGAYFVINIPPGKYEVQASMIGFQRMVQTGVVVNSGRTTTLDFKLSSETLQERPMIIEAFRPDVQPEKTSTSEIIRAEDIQQLAGMRDVGDVLGLAADVTDGHFRGGREGEELYTLQGMGITNPLDNTSAFLPIMSAVEEVEVITSGFGAQYGNAQSGVVNISMKEGKSDKWRSRVETRMRLPGKKHFGPSVYDTVANQYLATLLKVSSWFRTEGEDVYYKSMIDNITSMFGGDSVLQATVARRLWELQAKRGMMQNYGKETDYSVEVASGGPLNENMRLFLALRSNVVWPQFPTEQPDRQEQLMGNIVFDLGGGANLRLSGAFMRQNSNIFGSTNGLGFYNWLWDRILSIQYRKVTNTQFGLRFTEAISKSTFYELKLNYLAIKTIQGSPVAPLYVADSLLGTPQTEWAKMVATTKNGPDGFSVGSGNDNFRDELLNTISFEASITSQVTKSHMLNAGLQVNQYIIDINNNNNTRNPNGMTINHYSGKPYEIGLYAQDKMEFEGMIANAGLRLDMWNQNTEYYTDIMSPFRYDTAGSGSYNSDLAPKRKTPILGRLQPRVGISFPVSTTTVFHLNYGSFMQRPSFQYSIPVSISQGTGQLTSIGNPKLEPQTTNSYDVGVMQGLGEGFTLDVSGYYKDVKNLIQQASFTDKGDRAYTTYINRDYADIRGFRLALNRKRGSFTGTINYQYSVATGKSSTPFNASPAYIEDMSNSRTENMDNVPIKDIVLDFDRSHNLIINLAYVTDEQWGPRIFKVYPFGEMIFSSSSFARSGRPYTSVTFNTTGQREINNVRTPPEYNTNIRVTRRIRNFFGNDATIYFEVFNLFDNRILNYSYLFDQAGSYSTFNTRNYELYPLDSTTGIRYLNQSKSAPFLVDQSFLIYSNSPRSYSIGMIIEL